MDWIKFFRKKRVKIALRSDARVEELVPVFKKILDSFDPSLTTMEGIIDAFFHSKEPITDRIITVSGLLAPYGIELQTRIIHPDRNESCEILGCYAMAEARFVRILHFLSDGALGLSQWVVVA